MLITIIDKTKLDSYIGDPDFDSFEGHGYIDFEDGRARWKFRAWERSWDAFFTSVVYDENGQNVELDDDEWAELSNTFNNW